jgi:hypothetical protein
MQHSAFSVVFERALQSVDQRVALPYWDFTVEAAAMAQNASLSLADVSPVLTDAFFGAANNSGSSVVGSGRWAYTAALPASEAGGMASNAFGQLRAPWNNNGSPFVSRHVGELCGTVPVSPRSGT